MKIPEYQNTVGLDVPNVPMPQMPQAVPGSFGEPQARSIERLGQVGEQIASHLLERKKQQDEAYTADLDTHYRQAMQDALFNDEREKAVVNGQEIERPKGLLNQRLGQASNVTIRWDDWARSKKEQVLALAPTEDMRRKLGMMIDDHNIQARNTVIRHERTQTIQKLLNSEEANYRQQVHDAAAIDNKEALKNAVNIALGTSSNLDNIAGIDDSIERDKNAKERAGKLISSAVLARLNITGDATQAHDFLDYVKDAMEPDEAVKLSKLIDDGAEHIKKQNETKETLKYITNESDYLTKLSSGDLSWVNIDDIGRDARAGNISEKFSTAMINVIKAKGKYRPEEGKNINYPSYVEQIYKTQNQEELNNTILNILNDHKNISEDKLAILINGAMQRAKSLPLSTRFNEYRPGQQRK